MARNELLIDATAAEIMAVLLDPSRYANWVVGAKHVRRIDADWPAVDSAFHHTVGVGPLTTQDRTVVRERSDTRLVLDANAWPFGRATVDLTLLPEAGGGTRVVMVETPTAGPAALLPEPLADATIHPRNDLSLARLRDTVLQLRDLG